MDARERKAERMRKRKEARDCGTEEPPATGKGGNDQDDPPATGKGGNDQDDPPEVIPQGGNDQDDPPKQPD